MYDEWWGELVVNNATFDGPARIGTRIQWACVLAATFWDWWKTDPGGEEPFPDYVLSCIWAGLEAPTGDDAENVRRITDAEARAAICDALREIGIAPDAESPLELLQQYLASRAR